MDRITYLWEWRGRGSSYSSLDDDSAQEIRINK